VICVGIVGRVGRASESKVHRSVRTQTQSGGDRPEHEPPELVRPLNAGHETSASKMRPQDPNRRPKARRALEPRAGNAAALAKPEQLSSSSSLHGPPKPVENPNLQKRIHQTSLLLKRLENLHFAISNSCTKPYTTRNPHFAISNSCTKRNTTRSLHFAISNSCTKRYTTRSLHFAISNSSTKRYMTRSLHFAISNSCTKRYTTRNPHFAVSNESRTAARK
jgi:hypothetical protein